MTKELTLEEMTAKWSNIEEKVPSTWPNWEKAGVELAQDLCYTWNIREGELIRVIALVSIRCRMESGISLCLHDHIDPMFAYAGLYPEMQRYHTILPEGVETPFKEALIDVFEKRKKKKDDK
jgi:hypothetical protein